MQATRRALVTGGSGFIGGHLVRRLLDDGWRVRALERRADAPGVGGAGSEFEVATGDIRDVAAMKMAAVGCDTVFHLAGKVHALAERIGDDSDYDAVNVGGTRNVVDAALAAGATHFVFVSSVKAMGEDASECVDESATPSPATAYGRSKLRAEELVASTHAATGLHTVSLRLPLVYGPGNKGNLFRMIAAIDRGLFLPPPEVDNRRSMVHVDNVVSAAMLAASSPAAAGQSYIVTDRSWYSTRWLYEAICRALGKPVPRWQVPVAAFRALARAGDIVGQVTGKRAPFDSDAFDKLLGSAWYSSDKIVRQLGFRPSIALEEALPALIAWYRTVPA